MMAPCTQVTSHVALPVAKPCHDPAGVTCLVRARPAEEDSRGTFLGHDPFDLFTVPLCHGPKTVARLRKRNVPTQPPPLLFSPYPFPIPVHRVFTAKPRTASICKGHARLGKIFLDLQRLDELDTCVEKGMGCFSSPALPFP